MLSKVVNSRLGSERRRQWPSRALADGQGLVVNEGGNPARLLITQMRGSKRVVLNELPSL